MFFEHLEKVLFDTQFISKEKPGQVMNKLSRLFHPCPPRRARNQYTAWCVDLLVQKSNFGQIIKAHAFFEWLNT